MKKVEKTAMVGDDSVGETCIKKQNLMTCADLRWGFKYENDLWCIRILMGKHVGKKLSGESMKLLKSNAYQWWGLILGNIVARDDSTDERCIEYWIFKINGIC